MYTFWDYKRNRWERDAGLRLDHLLLNAKAAKRLVDAGVDREVRGLEGASDHAPAWIVLRDTPATRRKPARRSEKLTRPKSGKARIARRRCPADRCWSSTVIHSRIAPITLFRKQSCGAAASPRILKAAGGNKFAQHVELLDQDVPASRQLLTKAGIALHYS